MIFSSIFLHAVTFSHVLHLDVNRRVHLGTKLATVTTFFIIFTHTSHKLWHTKYAIQIGLKNADIKCCIYTYVYTHN